jgi:hypothetical protein
LYERLALYSLFTAAGTVSLTVPADGKRDPMYLSKPSRSPCWLVVAVCTVAAFAAAAGGAPAAPAPAAPPFRSAVERVTAAQLRFSWRRGCPVAPAQLRTVRLSYWGFDGRPHTGRLVVNADATRAVANAFRRLYRDSFPIRRMRPVDAYRGSDDASMAADNTSAFNCRAAVAAGPTRWSAHAYGRAVDVNPLENPYLEGGRVLPPAGRRFADRSRHRRGMAEGDLVSAFAGVGWGWGGRWSSPDYQHFSADGR